MNRRDFSAAVGGVLASAAAGVPVAALAQAKQPQEGIDYITLDKRVPVDASQGKVEVLEFFWYGCPHCNAFEPRFEPWVKRQAADVVVKRVPVAFRDDFVPHQRLYYTLEALGKVDQLHPKVYHAVHMEHQAVNREDLILAWAGKQGLDAAQFKELYNSFSVASKVRRATQLQNAYKVQGVPSIGVAGRWYTDGTLAGSMDRLLQVTDWLVADARKTR
ncbi:thiol:disulfide interchange protein DsbA/DsbL [Ramlibacter sp. RBP-2]|uniref:Thiol:disulfide interchange protein n=1 Tax=Ramlibacter lithotrophicus TaxID=2606681 RepID=A0A7X6DGZ2_9BURK|nr:thiol:disulfide interchange protein DsbA/DsbL [Ramlibacter lithotrophicus]NKE66991.1 thiol:disulfide interchange protein DsbA/DsbL [Ramlibacter lithotrophicus]